MLIIAVVAAIAGSAATPPIKRLHPNPSSPRREAVHPLSRERLPDGSELVAVEVRFPPGAAALPHRHPAFVYAYVVSGTIVSALNGEEPRTYRAGQSWHEEPGVLHRVTRNPSARKPATLLAVFITKPGESDLVQPVTGAR
jgi:quercetin dioxygenase-like cupin family protein